MVRKRITSRPGLFGSIYYYDENGRPIGKSRPGLLEGTRVYTDQNKRYAGKSRPGFLAKEVFTDVDHNHITSYESLCGDVHFKNGVPIGHSRPSFFGFEHTTLEAEDELIEEEYYEEDYLEEYLSQDIITDAAGCEEYAPRANQKAVIKNVLLFVLCLAICMVMVCVHAVIRFI